jgi:hypothetical protein
MAEDSLTISNPARDKFERYYAEKLWEWIPPIYRQEDGLAEQPYAACALAEILACQAAIARRSTTGCGRRVHSNLRRLGSSLHRRTARHAAPRQRQPTGRRTDVAKTVFYRRRKGTPVVMEALIQDITGWEGAVVEVSNVSGERDTASIRSRGRSPGP